MKRILEFVKNAILLALLLASTVVLYLIWGAAPTVLGANDLQVGDTPEAGSLRLVVVGAVAAVVIGALRRRK